VKIKEDDSDLLVLFRSGRELHKAIATATTAATTSSAATAAATATATTTAKKISSKQKERHNPSEAKLGEGMDQTKQTANDPIPCLSGFRFRFPLSECFFREEIPPSDLPCAISLEEWFFLERRASKRLFICVQYALDRSIF
jgi:hypothetical protein